MDRVGVVQGPCFAMWLRKGQHSGSQIQELTSEMAVTRQEQDAGL